MSAIPYWTIREEIAEIIKANLSGVIVEIEREIQFAAEGQPFIGIYLESRETPEDQQPIAAGRITRMFLNISIWVFAHAFDIDRGIEERDRIIGEVELILMGHRFLNQTVDACWLQGGELLSGRDAETKDFLAGGEIRLRMEVSARIDS